MFPISLFGADGAAGSSRPPMASMKDVGRAARPESATVAKRDGL